MSKQPSSWRSTVALQLRVLGRGPSVAEAFPWGPCVTTRDMLPTRQVLGGPPGPWHLAAPQSSLTGRAAPSQNSLALLLPLGPEARFHPSREMARSGEGPGRRPPASSWYQRRGLSR